MVRKEKAKYYTDQLSTADTKTVFRTVNVLLNRNNKSLPHTQSMSDLSEKFSIFFKNKIIAIRERIESANNHSVLPSDHIPSALANDDHVTPPGIFDFTPVSEDDILKIVKKSSNKSCDLDPIPTWLMKDNIQPLLAPLVSIVNVSLSTGKFPEALSRNPLLIRIL